MAQKDSITPAPPIFASSQVKEKFSLKVISFGKQLQLGLLGLAVGEEVAAESFIPNIRVRSRSIVYDRTNLTWPLQSPPSNPVSKGNVEICISTFAFDSVELRFVQRGVQLNNYD